LLGGKALVKEAGGRLIVFLSAKGGSGTSSLCANIATNIALYKPDSHVAVVDMVLPIGSIANIVGYQGDLNLVSMASCRLKHSLRSSFAIIWARWPPGIST